MNAATLIAEQYTANIVALHFILLLVTSLLAGFQKELYLAFEASNVSKE